MKQAVASFILTLLITCLAAAQVQAQGTDGTAAAGQEGSAYNNGPTGFQAGQDTSVVPSAPMGQTMPTYDNLLQTGGGVLRLPTIAPAQTGGLAQGSVNQAALPSGAFSFGFPQGPTSVTTDPYVPSGLPMTSTGSIDLNTADCPYCGQGVPIWGW